MPATPENQLERFDTDGRTRENAEALNHLWETWPALQAAFPDALRPYYQQAYAEGATQKTLEARRLTKLIWSEMESRGIVVSHDPVHFKLVRSASTS